MWGDTDIWVRLELLVVLEQVSNPVSPVDSYPQQYR
jgi:hypothetical protein